MTDTAELVARTKKPDRRVERTRIRAVVRRVDPWSVLKFSLLFYFCIMLIVLFGLAILYWVLSAIGAIDSLAKLIGQFGFGGDAFRIDGGWLFSRLFLIGIVGVAAWSLLNMCVAFLYNLVSDVVGGVEVTLAEKR
jgi:hypothetical protein